MFFDTSIIADFGTAATSAISATANIAGLGMSTGAVISAVKNDEENKEFKLASRLTLGAMLRP